MRLFLHVITSLAFIVMPIVAQAQSLLDGVYPFMCDDDSLVLIEDNQTWTSPSMETGVEIKKIEEGWRIEWLNDGDVIYLRNENSRGWKLQMLNQYGFREYSCKDLREISNLTLSAIKPRIVNNINKIEENAQKSKEEASVWKALADEQQKDKKLIQTQADEKERKLSEKIEYLERQIEKLREENIKREVTIYEKSKIDFEKQLSEIHASIFRLIVGGDTRYFVFKFLSTFDKVAPETRKTVQDVFEMIVPSLNENKCWNKFKSNSLNFEEPKDCERWMVTTFNSIVVPNYR